MNITYDPTTRLLKSDFDPTGIEMPEGLCLLAYRGSISHNLFVPKNDPNSIDDVDLIGIVIGEPKHYLGLHEWGNRGTKEIKQGAWDIVLYEIKKAMSLLLQGNPNILSLLWTRLVDYLWVDQDGLEIRNNRHLFVGKHVFKPFAGYSSAQLAKMTSRDPAELRQYLAVTYELKARGEHPNHKGERIPYPGGHDVQSGEGLNASETSTEKLLQQIAHYQKKGENLGYLGDKRKQLVLKHGFDCKNSSHLIRLLRMCEEFLRTGQMTVYRELDRDELLAIKQGEWTLEEVKRESDRLFEECRRAYDESPLQDGPNREKAEEMLIWILENRIRNCAEAYVPLT
jgi:hypothetical protein